MPLMASGCNRGNRIMNNQIIDEFDKASLIKKYMKEILLFAIIKNVVFWIEMMQLEKFRN